MHTATDFLLRHGHLVLTVWVFAEQVGLPIPSIPILLAAGALAGVGRMNPATSLLCCVVAAVIADSLWFQLGRLRGIQVLQLLCRISLEPESCVRRTEQVFSTRGTRTLLVSKFLPGVNTVAPPMAGVVHMKPWRFLLFDALGALLWAGTFIGLGYAFSGEIERLAASAETMGGVAVAVFSVGLAGYVASKLFARHRFLRELRIARIGVDDLKARIDSGEDLVIVDLRRALDVEAEPETIPGAFQMDAQELERTNDRLPRDREIILFCTCPNEATSARVALLLRRQGIRRIRPLEGGLAGWRERGYPLQSISMA
jgi:membrane protein DedA with SNARE-associated domain/rhodanese-related sulfurtransferase